MTRNGTYLDADALTELLDNGWCHSHFEIRPRKGLSEDEAGRIMARVVGILEHFEATGLVEVELVMVRDEQLMYIGIYHGNDA